MFQSLDGGWDITAMLLHLCCQIKLMPAFSHLQINWWKLSGGEKNNRYNEKGQVYANMYSLLFVYCNNVTTKISNNNIALCIMFTSCAGPLWVWFSISSTPCITILSMARLCTRPTFTPFLRRIPCPKKKETCFFSENSCVTLRKQLPAGFYKVTFVKIILYYARKGKDKVRLEHNSFIIRDEKGI